MSPKGGSDPYNRADRRARDAVSRARSVGNDICHSPLHGRTRNVRHNWRFVPNPRREITRDGFLAPSVVDVALRASVSSPPTSGRHLTPRGRLPTGYLMALSGGRTVYDSGALPRQSYHWRSNPCHREWLPNGLDASPQTSRSSSRQSTPSLPHSLASPQPTSSKSSAKTGKSTEARRRRLGHGLMAATRPAIGQSQPAPARSREPTLHGRGTSVAVRRS